MHRRDLGPLILTGAVAVVSVGLLLAAARWGWLGADVGRGDGFCEAARSGWVKQPANTASNLGFVLAGLAVAGYAADRTRLGGTLGRWPGLATGYAVVVVLLGPASAAMHATQSDLGGRLDMLSMYLVAGFALAYAVQRWVRGGPGWLLGGYAVVLVASELAENLGGHVPVVHHAGNLAFGLTILAAVAVEVALWRRGDPAQDWRWGAASVGTLLLAFAIWNPAQTGSPGATPTRSSRGTPRGTCSTRPRHTCSSGTMPRRGTGHGSDRLGRRAAARPAPELRCGGSPATAPDRVRRPR